MPQYISLDAALAAVRQGMKVGRTKPDLLRMIEDGLCGLPSVTMAEADTPDVTVKRETVRPMIPYGIIGMTVFECGKCGREVGRKDRFCPDCGARFGEPGEDQEGKA